MVYHTELGFTQLSSVHRLHRKRYLMMWIYPFTAPAVRPFVICSDNSK